MHRRFQHWQAWGPWQQDIFSIGFRTEEGGWDILDNRRKYMRFDTHFEVEFRPAADHTGFIKGVINNFSRKGFSVILNVFQFKEKIVKFRIKHPQKEILIPVIGRIMWEKQVNDRCYAGTKVIDIEKNARSSILVYVYSNWSGRPVFKIKDK